MKLILSAFLLATTVSCFAQTDKKWDFIPQGTIGIGVSFQKFKGLNERVANGNTLQLEPLKDHAGTLQLGWIKERNRVVSDFNLLGGSSLSGDRDKKSSEIRYLGINGNIGYDVLKSEQLLLFPYAGIGYQWYQARFFRDNSLVPFDGALNSTTVQNAIEPIAFKNQFFTYQVGLGFAVSSPKKNSGSIGLRAGYTGSFKSRNWRSNYNQELLNSPSDNLSQFNVALILGMQPMMGKH